MKYISSKKVILSLFDISAEGKVEFSSITLKESFSVDLRNAELTHCLGQLAIHLKRFFGVRPNERHELADAVF